MSYCTIYEKGTVVRVSWPKGNAK